MAVYDDERIDRIFRLALFAALGTSVLFAGLSLARRDLDPPASGAGHLLLATLVIVVYLPIHLQHLVHAARSARPPLAYPGLVVMAVVILGSLPTLRWAAVGGLGALIVSSIVVLPRPWSAVTALVVTAGSWPLAYLLGAPADMAAWTFVSVAWRSAQMYVAVRLMSTARQLKDARQALAREAVADERSRVEGDLRLSLGAALASIVQRGEAAERLVDAGAAYDHDLDEELRAVVAESRGTLAEARQLVRGYQQTTLADELESAATLLRAAGVDTRVVLAAAGLRAATPGAALAAEVGVEAQGDAADRRVRQALRALTARLLADDGVRGCVVTLGRGGGGGPALHVEVRRSGEPAAEETLV